MRAWRRRLLLIRLRIRQAVRPSQLVAAAFIHVRALVRGQPSLMNLRNALATVTPSCGAEARLEPSL